MRAAEFADVRALGVAAELHAHRHLAVADAEHRHARGEHIIRGARRAFVKHAGRAAGQDDALGAEGRDPRRIGVEGQDFAIDAALADAAGDQLRNLAAEIENKDFFFAHAAC